MTRIRALLASTALLGVVAGCGGTAEPAAQEPPASSGSLADARKTVSPTASGKDSGEPGGLAEKAEDVAGDEQTSTVPARSGQVLGGDISWPQCPKGMGIPERRTQGMPMPVPAAEYVVIGLTNGPAFTPNPCLADQVAWAEQGQLLTAAYSVLSYPTTDQLADHGAAGPHDGDTRLGALRNVGYQQARYNIRNLRGAGLQTPIVWLDVEPVSDWEWSGDLVANAAVVAGAARGYRDAGYAIGVYSTPSMYAEIVGDYALGVPEWRAAGLTSRAEALNRCGPDWSIQGGQAVLGQWVEADRDMNLTCPGAAADLGRWFHAT